VNRKRILCGLISCIGLISFSFGYVFSDLTEEHWAYNIVLEMHEKGIISGFYDGTFKPEDYVTKEQFATLLYKILKPSETGKLSFADVTSDYWSKSYVDVMGQYMEYKTINGNLYFEPGSFVKRESVAMALVKTLKLSEESANLALVNQFSDKAQISPGAQRAVALCIEYRIMSGNADGTFNPKSYLKRAEISAVLNNVLKNVDKELLENATKSEPELPEQPEEIIPEPEVPELPEEITPEPEVPDETLEDTPDESLVENGLNSWNGVYENNLATLELYRVAKDKLAVKVTKDMKISFFELPLNSTQQLEETTEFFDNQVMRRLTRTSNGVRIEVKSTDPEDWINGISGEYYEQDFEKNGWDGVYQNGKTQVTIAETKNSMYITIEGAFGSWSKYSHDYSKRRILYEGMDESVLIEHDDVGIYMKCSSNDSALSGLTGIYALID